MPSVGKLIIYGAGKYGRRLYTFCEQLDLKVDYFCQTVLEEKTYCYNVPIISLEQLLDMNGKRIVLIAIADKDVSRGIRTRLTDVLEEDLVAFDCGEFIKTNLEYSIKKVLYSGYDFEKKICEPYWCPYFEDKNKLVEAESALLANLTDDDKEKVKEIVERIERILYCAPFDPDIFSEKEKIQISKI